MKSDRRSKLWDLEYSSIFFTSMELSLQEYADSFQYLTQPNYSFTRNNMRNNDYFNDKKGDEADFAF